MQIDRLLQIVSKCSNFNRKNKKQLCKKLNPYSISKSLSLKLDKIESFSTAESSVSWGKVSRSPAKGDTSRAIYQKLRNQQLTFDNSNVSLNFRLWKGWPIFALFCFILLRVQSTSSIKLQMYTSQNSPH